MPDLLVHGRLGSPQFFVLRQPGGVRLVFLLQRLELRPAPPLVAGATGLDFAVPSSGNARIPTAPAISGGPASDNCPGLLNSARTRGRLFLANSAEFTAA